jgi:hypothetical protein
MKRRDDHGGGAGGAWHNKSESLGGAGLASRLIIEWTADVGQAHTFTGPAEASDKESARDLAASWGSRPPRAGPALMLWVVS